MATVQWGWGMCRSHWPWLVRSELAAAGEDLLASLVRSQIRLTGRQVLDNGVKETCAGDPSIGTANQRKLSWVDMTPPERLRSQFHVLAPPKPRHPSVLAIRFSQSQSQLHQASLAR